MGEVNIKFHAFLNQGHYYSLHTSGSLVVLRAFVPTHELNGFAYPSSINSSPFILCITPLSIPLGLRWSS